MNIVKQFTLTAALAAALPYPAAMGQSVGSPAATYVYDAVAGSIRPLIGVAGSAFLGNASISGMPLAAIAPNGVAAIAVWPDRVEWVTDPGNYPQSSTVIGGALANPDSIVWDRGSAAVTLASSSQGQVQFINFAGGAAAVQNAGMPDSCQGAVKLLAADPANAIAAVACATAPQQTAQSLFFVQPDPAARLVSVTDVPVAATFDESGAFYVAGAGSTISMTGNPATGSSADLLFQDANAPNAAAAITVQNKLLYYADGVQRQIRVYDLGSLQQVDELGMDWQPTQFQFFSATSFLMNTRASASDPILLLQTAPKRGVVFVPAGQ